MGNAHIWVLFFEQGRRQMKNSDAKITSEVLYFLHLFPLFWHQTQGFNNPGLFVEIV